MNTVFFSGLVLLFGGSVMVWLYLREHRRGDPAARGRLVTISGLAAYGALVLAGIVPGATGFASMAVWVIVILMWGGIFLSIRDRRRARQDRADITP